MAQVHPFVLNPLTSRDRLQAALARGGDGSVRKSTGLHYWWNLCSSNAATQSAIVAPRRSLLGPSRRSLSKRGACCDLIGRLPDDVLRYLLFEWLNEDVTLSALDAALCQRSLRLQFLRIIEGLTLESLQFPVDAMQDERYSAWFISRQLRCRVLLAPVHRVSQIASHRVAQLSLCMQALADRGCLQSVTAFEAVHCSQCADYTALLRCTPQSAALTRLSVNLRLCSLGDSASRFHQLQSLSLGEWTWRGATSLLHLLAQLPALQTLTLLSPDPQTSETLSADWMDLPSSTEAGPSLHFALPRLLRLSMPLLPQTQVLAMHLLAATQSLRSLRLQLLCDDPNLPEILGTLRRSHPESEGLRELRLEDLRHIDRFLDTDDVDADTQIPSLVDAVVWTQIRRLWVSNLHPRHLRQLQTVLRSQTLHSLQTLHWVAASHSVLAQIQSHTQSRSHWVASGLGPQPQISQSWWSGLCEVTLSGRAESEGLDDAQSQRMQSALGQLLREAHSLRTLRLRDWLDLQALVDLLRQLLREGSCADLSSLQLDCLLCLESAGLSQTLVEALVSLWGRSLQSLRLRRLFLSGACWTHLLGGTSSISHLHLLDAPQLSLPDSHTFWESPCLRSLCLERCDAVSRASLDTLLAQTPTRNQNLRRVSLRDCLQVTAALQKTRSAARHTLRHPATPSLVVTVHTQTHSHCDLDPEFGESSVDTL